MLEAQYETPDPQYYIFVNNIQCECSQFEYQ